MSLERWEAFLTELEDGQARGVDPAAESSQPLAAGWTAPDDLGELPAELEGRARRLHAAQQGIISDLESELHSTARSLAALRSVPSPEAKSVYLDVIG